MHGLGLCPGQLGKARPWVQGNQSLMGLPLCFHGWRLRPHLGFGQMEMQTAQEQQPWLPR